MDMSSQLSNKQRQNDSVRFMFNNLSFVVGLIMIVSGLTLQVGFHLDKPRDRHFIGQAIHSQLETRDELNDTSTKIWGFSYSSWSTIHKTAIAIFSILMVYHFISHYKWYKTVLTRKLVGKNIQVITLSAVFLLVAITGLIPWLLHLTGSTSIFRFVLIEIHDKVALILVVFIILHLIKKNKWFKSTYLKLRNRC